MRAEPPEPDPQTAAEEGWIRTETPAAPAPSQPNVDDILKDYSSKTE